MTIIVPSTQWTNDILRGLRVVTGPAVEPLSLSLVRSHLRLRATGSPAAHVDDEWLTEIGIPAARGYCEGFMMRSCALQTLEMELSRFPGSHTIDIGPTGIELLYGPVASIISLSHLDSSGGVVAMSTADYALTGTDPPRLYLTTADAAWPATFGGPGAVRIRYIAGYSPPGGSPYLTPELPAPIKAAMLMMTGALYENREAIAGDTADTTIPHEIPLGVAALLRPYVLRLSCA